MGRLREVKEMFASAFADLDHVLNFIWAGAFLVAIRLIEGAPFTWLEYGVGYIAGLIVFYAWDYRVGLLRWAWDRLLRGKADRFPPS